VTFVIKRDFRSSFAASKLRKSRLPDVAAQIGCSRREGRYKLVKVMWHWQFEVESWQIERHCEYE
jgi:hypothetical protein